jgi:hypothetical protein
VDDGSGSDGDDERLLLRELDDMVDPAEEFSDWIFEIVSS